MSEVRNDLAEPLEVNKEIGSNASQHRVSAPRCLFL